MVGATGFAPSEAPVRSHTTLTSDIQYPKLVRFQTAPRPEPSNVTYYRTVRFRDGRIARPLLMRVCENRGPPHHLRCHPRQHETRRQPSQPTVTLDVRGNHRFHCRGQFIAPKPEGSAAVVPLRSLRRSSVSHPPPRRALEHAVTLFGTLSDRGIVPHLGLALFAGDPVAA